MERGPSSAADGMKVGVIWEEETKESVAWGMEEALIDEGEGGGGSCGVEGDEGMVEPMTKERPDDDGDGDAIGWSARAWAA